MRLGIGISLLVACLLVGAPVFGTMHFFVDPNENGPPPPGEPDIGDEYDLKSLTLDDGVSAGNLRIIWETYENIVMHDLGQQVVYSLWLNVHGWDQDPLTANPDNGVLPNGWDFQIQWFGDQVLPSYPLEHYGEMLGQDGTVLWTSSPIVSSGTTLTLDIPFTAFFSADSTSDAFPNDSLWNPGPGFLFNSRLDNGNSFADDLLPDDEFGNVPEPLTMLGLFMGLGGIGAYIRRRRMA